ncbi:MAG: hypothetical protein DRR08_33970 [Candidatus Parabeggiatoa sp. nov. 2]|nr:MAG: hypothetical protein DRR08_33970 [Gammaproteobacteria bacterium]
MNQTQPIPNWAIETLVPEEVYTDRQEFLDYLYQAALKARTRRTGSTVLLGQRRMGKTEIFKRVVNRLFFEQDYRDPKAVVPVYYSFPDTFTDRWDFALNYVENFMRWYAAFRLHDTELLSDVYTPHQLIKIIQEKINLTKGFKSTLNFFEGLQNKEIIIPEQVALCHPRRVAAMDESTIVVFLDEFQNTRLPHYDFDVVGYMQEAVESPTCPHFVTGSAMSILSREILGRGSLFGRFESEPIEPLTSYWGTELVRKAARYYQADVSEEMAPIIAERCGGNPFYITALIKQAAKLSQAISDEETLNKILAVDLSSGFIWSELSDQVNRWIERINEFGITKWILYLSATQADNKDDEIYPEQIQQELREREGKEVSLAQIREVLIKLSRGDLLEYMELGGWFRKVQDPILLEFLKVWGRIEIERQNKGQVREALRLKYGRLKRQFSDLTGYLAEVYMVQILFNAQGQKLPGHYFHQDVEVAIPDFSYIHQREKLAPGADSEIDIHGGAGVEQWVAESKWHHGRKMGIAEIQKLIDKGEWVRKDIGADFARAWFFSHDGFTKEAESFMQEQGVLWSTREDLDGLLDYVKLRRLPNL